MKMVEVISPFNGRKVGEVPFSSKEEVEKIIDEAYEKFVNFKYRLPKYQIVEILEKAAKICEDSVEELTNLAASEGGKPYMDSKVEILRAINGIKLAISHLGSYEGKQIAMGHTKSSENRIAYTFKEPIGVVAAISAFNHPFNLAVHQVVPAIAVGCPVIIKPASSTPLSAFKLIEILEKAGLPKGYATAVLCDRDSAEMLASSKKISFLTFIGSAKVGWSLSKKVNNGTRIALEHGGVAPVIVEKDANLDEVIPALLKGGFYHAGQVCVSVQRVYAHKDIAKELANKLANLASKLVVGNQMDPKTEVGPLIDPKEVDRVEEWVNTSGGEILCGGKRLENNCYAPTVIYNAKDSATISQNEVFGPVVCVYSYENIDEAIKRANSLDVSFQAAIFTKNIDTSIKAVKELNATAVMVNDHTAFRVDWMPFGGAKSSGIGVGGINYSMEEMSNQKLFVIKSNSI